MDQPTLPELNSSSLNLHNDHFVGLSLTEKCSGHFAFRSMGCLCILLSGYIGWFKKNILHLPLY